jgi:hypothetical protein
MRRAAGFPAAGVVPQVAAFVEADEGAHDGGPRRARASEAVNRGVCGDVAAGGEVQEDSEFGVFQVRGHGGHACQCACGVGLGGGMLSY